MRTDAYSFHTGLDVGYYGLRNGPLFGNWIQLVFSGSGEGDCATNQTQYKNSMQKRPLQ
jgi:hypothetical protein